MHLFLHFVVPALFAGIFFSQDWKRAYFVMVLTMIVDIDHLLATPVYDPGRCSIGFHPLHTYLPILTYAALCFLKRFRYIGIGLIIHMALDSLDCQYTNGIWST